MSDEGTEFAGDEGVISFPNRSDRGMPVVVGLLGKAGSGKTTAARYMSDRYQAHRVSFANPLKEMAKAIWLFTDEQVYGEAEAKEKPDIRWNITPRLALQRLGVAARDFLYPQIWVEAAFHTITDHYVRNPGQALYVIDDVRFLNEVAAIRGCVYKGKIIELVCEDSSSQADTTHASESEMDQLDPADIDATILSHKTPESAHLKSCIDDVVERLVVPLLLEKK